MFAACATMAAAAEYAYLVNKIAFFQTSIFKERKDTYEKMNAPLNLSAVAEDFRTRTLKNVLTFDAIC
jgi:hypothetical protein